MNLLKNFIVENLHLGDSERMAILFLWTKFQEERKWPSLKRSRKNIKDSIDSNADKVLKNLQPVFMINPQNGSREEVCKLTLLGVFSIEKHRDEVAGVLCRYFDILKNRFNQNPDFKQITSKELENYFSKEELSMLAVLIHMTHFWSGLSGVTDDANSNTDWSVDIPRNIEELDDCNSSEEFLILLLSKFIENHKSEMNRYATMALWQVSPRVSAPSLYQLDYYVSTNHLSELYSISEFTSWDLKKLIRLLEEINETYQRGNLFACAMLLRAVIDHVPPIWGKKSFNEVTSHLTGISNKRQLERLEKSLRNVSDGALHKHIRKKEFVIEREQLKFEPEIAALIEEIILELKNSHQPKPAE